MATPALTLWQVLARVYDDLGLSVIDDATFQAIVLARVVKPTAKSKVPRHLIATYGANVFCHHFAPRDAAQPWGVDDIGIVMHADFGDPTASMILFTSG